MIKPLQLKSLIYIFAAVIFCAPWLNQVESARILVVFPVPARSHLILGYRLVNELATRGHEVTFITAISQNKNVPNVTEIVIEEALPEMEKQRQSFNMFDMDSGFPLEIYFTIFFVSSFGARGADLALGSPNVQKLLKSDATFDLVIIENFCNEAHYVFAHHFKAPVVVFSTIGSGSWTNNIVRNPAPLSHVPNLFLNYKPRMNFWERVSNTIFNVYYDLVNNFYFYRVQNNLIKKYFPDAPELYEMQRNTSLILLNSHVSTSPAVPHVPNMIEIGGFHVEPPKALPKDLQEYLDSAEQGVVYFSMGSNLRSAQMPTEKREAILKVFSKLKQKVLWKFEEDDLPGQPKNVKIGKWLPQQDILAHPNVKVFITHGGMLSTTEAIYHGVPVIGIPIFGDQKTNILGAVNNGYGIAVSYRELTEESLGNALNEMLNNPKYFKNAKQRSRIMHDQPTKPLDTAVFWVEYVLRHNGATHLKTSAMDLNHWYEYMLLDVLLFLTIDIVVIIVVLYTLGKKLCGRKQCDLNKITKDVKDKKKRV